MRHQSTVAKEFQSARGVRRREQLDEFIAHALGTNAADFFRVLLHGGESLRLDCEVQLRGKTNRAELMEIINRWAGQLTVAEIMAALDEVGIPAARYNELPDVWEEPQVKHRKLRATTPHPYAEAGSVDLIASPLAQMSASPATIRLPPPMLGEHTGEVLNELGYGEERIAGLRGLKII